MPDRGIRQAREDKPGGRVSFALLSLSAAGKDLKSAGHSRTYYISGELPGRIM